jgi:protein-tyrosine phosphatase
MRAWRQAGVDSVVSLLTAGEEKDLDLVGERAATEAAGMAFHSFPIVDRSVPESRQEAARFAGQMLEELARGMAVVIHCRQGIGRAALLAASVMMLRGFTMEQSLAGIGKTRGVTVPETPEQRTFLLQISEELGAAPMDVSNRV